MTHTPEFYFMNLCADASRCVLAAKEGDGERYADSLARSYKTLSYLRDAGRPEAYEEGFLLMRGLEFARIENDMPAFQKSLDGLMATFAPALSA